jgi:hypothetical protein
MTIPSWVETLAVVIVKARIMPVQPVTSRAARGHLGQETANACFRDSPVSDFTTVVAFRLASTVGKKTFPPHKGNLLGLK